MPLSEILEGQSDFMSTLFGNGPSLLNKVGGGGGAAMTQMKQTNMYRSNVVNAGDALDHPEAEPEDPKLKFDHFMTKVKGPLTFEK